ncbi:Signal peptidase complex catalytic subunit [Vermiconidia calcicola]|uniref:Signal peptidase complex catalytic subunit n=1 Tax=Vermiconidia calcicola TaxID=1690605 RepID=A0ACC3NWK8_9PEZI|nr:Signal peptidase complex catalytic subunit [Vermiconidia calcicola]
MEPAFRRGDLLLLWNRGMDTHVGEIVVFNVRGEDIPVVHRVIQRFGGGSEPLQLLTKGDNNPVDDTEIYARNAPGQAYLDKERDVVGSVAGTIPCVGYVTVIFGDYPWLKAVLFGLLGLSVVMQKN